VKNSTLNPAVCRYAGAQAAFEDIPGCTVISNPIEVFSHTQYLNEKQESKYSSTATLLARFSRRIIRLGVCPCFFVFVPPPPCCRACAARLCACACACAAARVRIERK
jgi:hypothetical protein